MAPERILVVKLADLGDVLLCEPALRSLRAGFPAARIDLLVPPASAEIARMLGHGARVVTFPKRLFDEPRALLRPDRAGRVARFAWGLRRARYDRVVILHHLTTPAGAHKFRALARAARARVVVGLDNGRGGFLTHPVDDRGFGALHEADYALAVARAAGGAPVDAAPRLAAPGPVPASLSVPPRYIAIYPVTGAYSSARAWPVDRFVALARELAGDGNALVVVGAVDASTAAHAIGRAVPAAVDLTGRTTLRELAAVVARARAVVGGDSFIGHLAAALDRPVVAIFGPSNDDAWKPYGATRHAPGVLGARRVVRRDIPCSPCLYTGFALGRRAGCPTRTCLATLPVADVASAVREAIGGVMT